jgi:uncharacterized protein (UPF0548 family)
MLLLQCPTDERIRRFLAAAESDGFSYPEVGATRGVLPKGCAVDHNRLQLGSGQAAFARAVAAMHCWEMFHLGWVRLCWPDAPIEERTTVAILSHQWGFWSLNASRILYLIEEDGPVRRHGFAYGTLAQHVESGEERFVVEWRKEDDSVWYDLLAFSRPNHFLVAAGYPLARRLQRRFAADSKRAMLHAVQSGSKAGLPR